MSVALEFLLERGFNPNINNNIEELLDRKQSETSKGNNTSIAIPKENIAVPSKTIAIPEILSIKEAFEFALNLK